MTCSAFPKTLHAGILNSSAAEICRNAAKSKHKVSPSAQSAHDQNALALTTCYTGIIFPAEGAHNKIVMLLHLYVAQLGSVSAFF